MNKKVSIGVMIGWILKSFVLAFFLMLVSGYLMGYQVMIVNGGSAEPYIHYHSIIVIKDCTFEEIKVGTAENNYEDGDFVTFTSTGTAFTTNRVVAKDENTQVVTTNGYQLGELQNEQEYPAYSQIVGRVVYTNYVVGTLIYQLKSTTNIIMLILGVAIIYVFKSYFLYNNEFKDIK